MIRWQYMAGGLVTAMSIWLSAPSGALALVLVVDTITDSAAPAFQACDSTPGVIDCSLRGAIMKSQSSPGPHSVILPAGTYTLTIQGSNEDLAASGDLDISTFVNLNGASVGSTVIHGDSSVSPSLRDRIFHILPGGILSVRDLTIRLGSTDGNGGGIFAQRPLTIDRTLVRENAANNGGGIYIEHNSFIKTATISNNTAGQGGAGIFVKDPTGASSVTIQNSTVSTNAGGGAWIDDAQSSSFVRFINSTVANNSHPSQGGGIARVTTGSIFLRNTLIANNIAGLSPNCLGTASSEGHNLIFGGDNCGLDTSLGDIINTGNPNLGPLQKNGGPTFTLGLAAGSAAIDTGDPGTPGSGGNTCEPTDQRGNVRPTDGDGIGGARCDIGAFELALVRPPASTGVFRPSAGHIFLKNQNTSGFADVDIVFGNPGDKPVAGDWNADGTDTIGVYRNGSFFLRNTNSTGIADLQVTFGLPGDLPVAGDWNGDGTDTVGVYRNVLFMITNNNANPGSDLRQFSLGISGDLPISGDWNGDGVDTVGVFRPTDGHIYLKNSSTTGFADVDMVFGFPNDKPFAGDWDGNGTDTIGVFRGGEMLLRNTNSSGNADVSFILGLSSDVPIAGDWDGVP